MQVSARMEVLPAFVEIWETYFISGRQPFWNPIWLPSYEFEWCHMIGQENKLVCRRCNSTSISNSVRDISKHLYVNSSRRLGIQYGGHLIYLTHRDIGLL
jgi:hypothetical protein